MAKSKTPGSPSRNKPRVHLTPEQRREVERWMQDPEIRHAITGGRNDVDAEECFLPLLLLMGLWGGSRAMRRSRGAGGMFSGGNPGSGMFGGGNPGSGMFGGGGAGGGWPLGGMFGGNSGGKPGSAGSGWPGAGMFGGNGGGMSGSGGAGGGWPLGGMFGGNSGGNPGGADQGGGGYGGGMRNRFPFMF